jgi:ATP-binding cassette subfamily B protein
MSQDNKPSNLASRGPTTRASGGNVTPAQGIRENFRAEPNSDLRWKTVFAFGCRFLGLCRGLVIIYAVLSLTDDAIDRGVAQLFGFLTNQVSISHPVNATKAAAPPGKAPSTVQASDASSGDRANQRLIKSYVGWAFLTILGVAFSIPFRWLTTKMDALLSNRLRTRLFDRVLTQSPEFFHKYDPGQLNAIVNQMTLETEMTLRQIIVDPFLQLIVLGGTTWLLSYNFIQLHKAPLAIFGATVPAGVVPPVIVLVALCSPYLITRLAHRIRAAATSVQSSILELSSLITGATQSPEEIQTLEAEPIFSDKHNTALSKSLNAKLQQSVAVETINLLNRLPSLLVQIVLLGFAVWLVLKPGGTARPGDVVAVLLLAPMLMAPIQALSGYLVMASSSWPSIDTVIRILKSGPKQQRRVSSVSSDEMQPTIEVRNVAFSYAPASPQIFSGISFTIPPKRTTGLVAKMGQGKTTFFKLALRFYDPQAGEILVGGRPTVAYETDVLRQRIAMMSQFPAFFFDSVRENLRMARPTATDAEIQSLCECTGVWKILLQKLPHSPNGSVLDSNLAAGKTLSGGERKLLALTRCLLRNPAVLFLDEPTVGMDNEEKFEIRRLLREATRDKTVMVVDHDVNWLLQFCDYFVVLDGGKVVEQGTAAELLSRDGLLYQLYMAAMGPKTKEIATYISRVQPGAAA